MLIIFLILPLVMIAISHYWTRVGTDKTLLDTAQKLSFRLYCYYFAWAGICSLAFSTSMMKIVADSDISRTLPDWIIEFAFTIVLFGAGWALTAFGRGWARHVARIGLSIFLLFSIAGYLGNKHNLAVKYEGGSIGRMKGIAYEDLQEAASFEGMGVLFLLFAVLFLWMIPRRHWLRSKTEEEKEASKPTVIENVTSEIVGEDQDSSHPAYNAARQPSNMTQLKTGGAKKIAWAIGGIALLAILVFAFDSSAKVFDNPSKPSSKYPVEVKLSLKAFSRQLIVVNKNDFAWDDIVVILNGDEATFTKGNGFVAKPSMNPLSNPGVIAPNEKVGISTVSASDARGRTPGSNDTALWPVTRITVLVKDQNGELGRWSSDRIKWRAYSDKEIGIYGELNSIVISSILNSALNCMRIALQPF